MFFILGLICGVLVEFFFARFAESTNKKAGDACCGNCAQCSAHCVGYHCFLVRTRTTENQVEQNETLWEK